MWTHPQESARFHPLFRPYSPLNPTNAPRAPTLGTLGLLPSGAPSSSLLGFPRTVSQSADPASHVVDAGFRRRVLEYSGKFTEGTKQEFLLARMKYFTSCFISFSREFHQDVSLDFFFNHFRNMSPKLKLSFQKKDAHSILSSLISSPQFAPTPQDFIRNEVKMTN